MSWAGPLRGALVAGLQPSYDAGGAGNTTSWFAAAAAERGAGCRFSSKAGLFGRYDSGQALAPAAVLMRRKYRLLLQAVPSALRCDITATLELVRYQQQRIVCG